MEERRRGFDIWILAGAAGLLLLGLLPFGRARVDVND
jgi:hypothetical protein